MNLHIIYKGIKGRLNDIAPVFYYIGQYTKGKDNTSYKVPAIYVEMPKATGTAFFRKIQAMRNAPIRIHLINNAPFKNHDSAVQDGAIIEHNNMLVEIDKRLTGWALKDEQSRLLTQQLIPTNANLLNFKGLHVFSINTYTTELYSYHLL